MHKEENEDFIPHRRQLRISFETEQTRVRINLEQLIIKRERSKRNQNSSISAVSCLIDARACKSVPLYDRYGHDLIDYGVNLIKVLMRRK